MLEGKHVLRIHFAVLFPDDRLRLRAVSAPLCAPQLRRLKLRWRVVERFLCSATMSASRIFKGILLLRICLAATECVCWDRDQVYNSWLIEEHLPFTTW
ncbi:hypothetical protein MHYP_G00323250 [Metynnis hypsauchen]